MFKTQESLSVHYERLKAFLRHLKYQCIRHRDQSNDIPTFVNEVLPLMIEASDRLSSVPGGLVDYARTQEDDIGYDVAAEFLSVRTAVEDVKSWLISNVPTSGGFVADRAINPDGSVSPSILSSGARSSVQGKLQLVIDTIE